jgi:hypothetical protein
MTTETVKAKQVSVNDKGDVPARFVKLSEICFKTVNGERVQDRASGNRLREMAENLEIDSYRVGSKGVYRIDKKEGRRLYRDILLAEKEVNKTPEVKTEKPPKASKAPKKNDDNRREYREKLDQWMARSDEKQDLMIDLLQTAITLLEKLGLKCLYSVIAEANKKLDKSLHLQDPDNFEDPDPAQKVLDLNP